MVPPPVVPLGGIGARSGGLFDAAVDVAGEAGPGRGRGSGRRRARASRRSRSPGSRANACSISASVFITNGPYWATGSPIGRPWSTQHLDLGASPATSSTGDVGLGRRRRCRCRPRRRRRARCRPRTRRAPGPSRARRPAGSAQRAPGSRRRCQMATSASGAGGVRVGRRRRGRRRRPSEPAMTVTSVARPVVGPPRTTGMSPSQSIVKYGSTSLSAAGRFSQIWNSSSGFGRSRSSSGNISAWTMPAAGGEPLHVAPAEAGGGAERVGVVDEAPAHVGDRLEAPVRVAAGSRARRGRGTCSSRPGRRSPARGRGRRRAPPAPARRRRRGSRRRGGRRTGTGRSSATGRPAPRPGGRDPAPPPAEELWCGWNRSWSWGSFLRAPHNTTPAEPIPPSRRGGSRRSPSTRARLPSVGSPGRGL